MQLPKIHLLFVWFILAFFLFTPIAHAVGVFSEKWNFPILISPITPIKPHALDSIDQTVYFGSSVTTGFTNFLYAVNITTGQKIWQYNTSLPVNYVSHLNSNGENYIIAGTGGSTTLSGISYVYCFNLLNNITRWKSNNFISSVTSLGMAKSYTSIGEDVVAGLENGTVVRLRGDNGAVLWSYTCLDSIVCISELENGSIVVGSGESTPAPGIGYVYCLNADGSVRWGPVSKNSFLTLLKKFSDVNGDGEPDVVAVFRDNLIHVIDGQTGNEFPPWPFTFSGDRVKDLLCTEDYTGDGFPDMICGTDNGNLTIINGLTAQLFRATRPLGYTVSYIQYMYFYENGIAYLNKTLAVSLMEYVSPSTFVYYIRGVNASDLSPMKQYQVSSTAKNLYNVPKLTTDFVGDLIFTADNVVYYISGADIIVAEFPSHTILVTLIILVWLLVASFQRKRH